MRFIAALVITLLGVLVAPPASAETVEPPRGMSTSVACVTPMATGTHGWQIGSGIRFWNAAQSHVRLTRRQLGPACGTIHAGTFVAGFNTTLGARAGHANFTGWDQGYGSNGAWFYPSVTVEFNDRHRLAFRKMADFKCWKDTVVAHELGHALGLQHSDDPNSVMSTGDHLGPMELQCVTRPTPGDLAALDAIYALR